MHLICASFSSSRRYRWLSNYYCCWFVFTKYKTCKIDFGFILMKRVTYSSPALTQARIAINFITGGPAIYPFELFSPFKIIFWRKIKFSKKMGTLILTNIKKLGQTFVSYVRNFTLQPSPHLVFTTWRKNINGLK